MASYIKPNFHTLKQGADLSAKQFHFVKANANEDEVVAAGAGEGVMGALMSLPPDATVGNPVELALLGSGGKIKLAGTVARGGEIMSDANGAGVAATATNYVGAIAQEAGVSGDVISVQMVRYKI